jgi:ABC-type transport system involved in multi-copper enzyme maturation permease subunit
LFTLPAMATFLQRLGGLSPLGPLFSKELRATARRKRTYLLRFLYLLALLMVLLMVYAANNSDYRYTSVAQRAQKNAEMGMYFFATFCMFTMIAMALIGPILTATAVNSERLHKTLPVLLMTPITAWQIISGKLFSRLLIAITLLSLSLPVLAVVRLLGGVEAEQVIASISICLVTVIVGASVALFLSTLMNRAYVVILLAYAFIAFIWMFIPFVTVLIISITRLDRTGKQFEVMMMQVAGLWELPANMVMVAIPEARSPGFLPWWASCLVWLAFSAFLVFWSSLLLRRMARKEQEGGGRPSTPYLPSNLPTLATLPPLPPPAMEATAGPSAPPPLPSAQPALIVPPAILPYRASFQPQPKPERTISDNPVLWRELRRPLMTRRWQAVLSTVIVLVLLIGIYLLLLASRYGSNSALGEADTQIGFAFVFCAILNILFCIVSATAIAQEKESDTWTLLLATPLKSSQIVTGKLIGLARRMLWPCILITAHFLLFTLTGVISFTSLVIVLYLIFTTNIIWLATGLYLSLRCKTVTMAIIYNLLGPVLAYLVPFALLLIYTGFFDRGGNLPEVVGVYTPYPHMAITLDDLERHSSRTTVNFPFFHDITIGQFYLATFLLGAAHLLLTAAVIFLTIKTFDRIVGRAAQRPRRQITPNLAPA